jgi:hypothetical protein
MISFEWDSNKSDINLEKHGISFDACEELWNDPNMAQIGSRLDLEIERRYLVIGRIKHKMWTAIITMRGEKIRIISIRRSRKSEENIYYGTQEKNKR